MLKDRFDGTLPFTAPEPEPYEIVVDPDESDRRLELLHDNVKRFGTVFNTVAPGTQLSGVLRCKA